ncbi:haloacid dehalogenase-like hydrolase family member protein [Theileria equi strain WA]|uniref:Haloacid dehalogenase-like hydrolase family member protein n=1 Tax=Theileria equi strain WA TaxID=1537102 RepID=L1LC04_THEEQ|nr:haloacid dehalogenase-like hydrolase family member protein [Theileria equi strain WA]EKX72765.1 haloacid dehalogenase-like hydrolase family member protein [Theileria equi strain WA]|eukprot:XP_004832217.1 haloacid dehalogenase-like hydrolase family member protein [Theileria equi strain WA]
MKIIALLFLKICLDVAVVSGTGGREEGQLRGQDSIQEIPSNTSKFEKPQQLPKFFGIDCDETFLTENAEGLKKNIEAFAEVKKRGFMPFFCTGKPLSSILALLGDDFEAKTGYKGYPGVYNNGSIVYDENGNVVYSKAFTREFLSTFLKSIEDGNLSKICTFHSKDAIYSLIKAEGMWIKYLESQGFSIPEVKTPQEIQEFEIVNIYIMCENLKIGDLKEGVDYIAVRSVSGVFDVNPAGVTKMTGMKTLLSRYNEFPPFCGYIGDGDNDVECLDVCSQSFAVGDAKDVAKKHAKWVLSKSYNDGAVAEALELLYGPLSVA